jgi:hypothetical protein
MKSRDILCWSCGLNWWWFDFRRTDMDSSFPSLPLPSSSLCLCRPHSRAPSHVAQHLHPQARSLKHLRARPSHARKCVVLRGSPGPCARPRLSCHPQDHPFMRLQIHRLARLQAHHLVRPQACCPRACKRVVHLPTNALFPGPQAPSAPVVCAPANAPSPGPQASSARPQAYHSLVSMRYPFASKSTVRTQACLLVRLQARLSYARKCGGRVMERHTCST